MLAVIQPCKGEGHCCGTEKTFDPISFFCLGAFIATYKTTYKTRGEDLHVDLAGVSLRILYIYKQAENFQRYLAKGSDLVCVHFVKSLIFYFVRVIGVRSVVLGDDKSESENAALLKGEKNPF